MRLPIKRAYVSQMDPTLASWKAALESATLRLRAPPPIEAAVTLRCRFCRAALTHETTPVVRGSDGDGEPSSSRWMGLPSDHWLELADFWLCHDDGDVVLFPVWQPTTFGGVQKWLVGNCVRFPAYLSIFFLSTVVVSPAM